MKKELMLRNKVDKEITYLLVAVCSSNLTFHIILKITKKMQAGKAFDIPVEYGKLKLLAEKIEKIEDKSLSRYVEGMVLSLGKTRKG